MEASALGASDVTVNTVAPPTQPPSFLHGPPTATRGRQTAELLCPKIMVGRVIGKNGETIKALQIFTGALIQIDQSVEPTRVTVSGNTQSLSLALSMISDVCKGTFKGFALLRQMTQQQRTPGAPHPAMLQSRPVYAPGYGLIPPSQLYGGDVQSGMPVLPRPEAVQLPTGFQYVTPTAGTPSQVILQGLPSMAGMPDQTAMLNPAQQMVMPQVYSTMSLNNPMQYGTQLAYYQPSVQDMQPQAQLGREQRQQQQQQQQYMFQPVEQARHSGVSLQPVASMSMPPADIFQDQDHSRTSAGLYTQPDGTTSMPLPGVVGVGMSSRGQGLFQAPPQALDIGSTGGLIQRTSDGQFTMHSAPRGMFQQHKGSSHSTPLPQMGMSRRGEGSLQSAAAKSAGSSSTKLIQAVLGSQSRGGDATTSRSSDQRDSYSSAGAATDAWAPSEVKLPSVPGSQSNSAPLPRAAPTNAVVEELLGGTQASTGGTEGPVSSSHLSMGSANTGTGQLVQVMDAEGQVGYYYNE